MTEIPTTLLSPRGGVPPVIFEEPDLTRAIEEFATLQGPIAIDAERASGYRYTQRAYLIQIRRGGKTFLIDPIGFDDLQILNDTWGDTEWVLHAASQDLPCLREVGLTPQRLFDTELAGRLAGFPRVNLATLVGELLNFHLEKNHAAVDWSTRPLPHEWLTYAALDVELLLELREALTAELERQGKLPWALEEFAAIVAAEPPPEKSEPWRRTSGIHNVRTPIGLARLRSLWETRDRLAAERDIAPGRILPDRALVAASMDNPTTQPELFKLPGFGGAATRHSADVWLEALASAHPSDGLLPLTARNDTPPPTPRWATKNPEAAQRLTSARSALATLSDELRIPPENILAPDALRRLAWIPPEPLSVASISDALESYGARSWQRGLVSELLTDAFRSPQQ